VITLYVDSGYFSPYALSAFAAAREKGIALSIQTIDLHLPAAAMSQEPGRSQISTSP